MVGRAGAVAVGAAVVGMPVAGPPRVTVTVAKTVVTEGSCAVTVETMLRVSVTVERMVLVTVTGSVYEQPGKAFANKGRTKRTRAEVGANMLRK